MTRLPPWADSQGVARQSCKPAPGTCRWEGRLDRPPGRRMDPNLQAPGLGRKVCPRATGRACAARITGILSLTLGAAPQPDPPPQTLGEGLPPPAPDLTPLSWPACPCLCGHCAALASPKEACVGLSPRRTLPSPPGIPREGNHSPRSREFRFLCSPCICKERT